jgi:adenylosuccinate lyase
MSKNTHYENPLVARYASPEMSRIFSPDFKFRTWRTMWIALAEAERELGLPISEEQIKELKSAGDINYDVARQREKETRHDVMSHVFAFGEQAPGSKGIIHLGATSAFVADNTDLVQLKAGLELVGRKLRSVIRAFSDFAEKHKDLPTLGFTHFQPAQLTTVGKRAVLWLQDFIMDHQDLTHRLNHLKFRGVKGTTGTQASFLNLFEGDHGKVAELDRQVTEAMGFSGRNYETGQTYPRKVDAQVLAVLSGIAQSAHKFATDLRLLANLKEMEEPFEAKQIGSSAMAYKRNPMRSERVCALARYVMSSAMSPVMTASVQWFERTLDDSANKRITIPESFLAIDSILIILENVVNGLVIYPKMIEKRIQMELPFMMTENLMMEAVKRGGDRQELHEKIRQFSVQAGKRIKLEGGENNLLDLIADDSEFPLNKEQLLSLAEPSAYIGRAPEQVHAFIAEVVEPLLKPYQGEHIDKTELRV